MPAEPDRRLTKAQLGILARMYQESLFEERDLVNGDECLPSWWIDLGFAVNAKSARALARSQYVEFYRHEGGQPGVDRYRLTNAGRDALARSEGE